MKFISHFTTVVVHLPWTFANVCGFILELFKSFLRTMEHNVALKLMLHHFFFDVVGGYVNED